MAETVLAVDDDPKNLMILELYLEEAGYTVRLAEDGTQALEVLARTPQDVGVVVLDRMMPGLNGLDVVVQMQARPETATIPVIMQTAAAAKEQIAQGIQAGVSYYLTKPYEKEVLLAIVYAALRDAAKTTALQAEVSQYKRLLDLTQQSDFRFCTRVQAIDLATCIATFYPQPMQAILGISELLLNAVEHGNAGITYEEKTRLLETGVFEQEVDRRCALPENAAKTVQVHYEKTNEAILLDIQDEGQGFDWEQYLELSPERAMDSHGRGIAMARKISFDDVRYIGCGNRVVCRVNLSTQADEQAQS